MRKILLALVVLLSFSLSVFAAVNINTATQAELESLKNIGPVKAQAIIDYRKKNGGFKSVDELNNVHGIGDKTMANLKNDISISGATTVAPTSKTTKPTKAAEVAAPASTPADTTKADKKAAADAKKAAKKAEADKKAADVAKAK
ncbi:MAG: helix-hairpin-helix domain-containing protein [Pseudomonadota bacterium]